MTFSLVNCNDNEEKVIIHVRLIMPQLTAFERSTQPPPTSCGLLLQGGVSQPVEVKR